MELDCTCACGEPRWTCMRGGVLGRARPALGPAQRLVPPRNSWVPGAQAVSELGSPEAWQQLPSWVAHAVLRQDLRLSQEQTQRMHRLTFALRPEEVSRQPPHAHLLSPCIALGWGALVPGLPWQARLRALWSPPPQLEVADCAWMQGTQAAHLACPVS